MQWLFPRSSREVVFSPIEADIGFRGSYQERRYEWLQAAHREATSAGLSTQFFFHPRKPSRHSVTIYRDYLSKVASTRAVLNLTQKTETEHILNGRAFETLLAGRLLLQQEGAGRRGSPLKTYLTPFLHYLPYESQEDLRRVILFLASHTETTEGIALSGARMLREQYSPVRLWAALLTELLS